MRINCAMVFVSDMKRAVAFYRDILGLPLRFESPHWTEFTTDGATLALHAAEGASPQSSGAHEAHAGLCRPGFQVPELNAFHERMLAHAVRCVQEPKDLFGSRVAQYADPDGLIFSVGEERRA
jgi:catechol 2,3-dioxygenase-like lactoylglutathione lyase family enzyme